VPALGVRQADPLCLNVEFIEKKRIGFMNRCRQSAALLQGMNCTDVIDMRVSAHDLLCCQALFLEPPEDLVRIIARIDDDGFAGFLVGEYGAVALERANWECFDDHLLIS
jgi:hypothetical protein